MHHLDILHAIVLRDLDYDLRYVLGLLNSSAMSRYYRLITLSFGRVMAQTNIETILQLPLRAINFDISADVAYHDKMVALVERMLALHYALQSASKTDQAALEQQIAEADAEIDALVYELYGLTGEEIAIVEEQNR